MGKKQTKKSATAKRQRADDLTARQAAFVREYLVSRNATKAAIAAGYSEATAAQQATRLLKNVQIREAIRQEDERALAAARVTRQAIIGELARIGLFDIRQVVAWGPNGLEIKASDKLTADVAAAIQSVEVKPTDHGRQIKVKAHDKLSALKELARIMRLYPEDSIGDNQDDGAIDDLMAALEESRKRAREGQ